MVNAFLIGVWALTGHGYFWPAWVLGGWGIGLALARLAEEDRIAWTLWCIDGSVVRAHQHAAGARRQGQQALAGRDRQVAGEIPAGTYILAKDDSVASLANAIDEVLLSAVKPNGSRKTVSDLNQSKLTERMLKIYERLLSR